MRVLIACEYSGTVRDAFIREGALAGSVNYKGYRVLSRLKKTFFAHKMVWLAETAYYPNEEQVDHKNGVRDDNRFSNLRLCSNFENSLNRPVRGKSKYRGVYFDSVNQKWRAETYLDGKKKTLGRFITEEDAYNAWLTVNKEKYNPEFEREVANGFYDPTFVSLETLRREYGK